MRSRFLGELATRWFGTQYESGRGIVRFTGGHYRVRRSVVPLDTETARQPDVAFFVERNPGHASGDELVCLAEITWRDLVRALARLVMKQMGMSRQHGPRRAAREAHS